MAEHLLGNVYQVSGGSITHEKDGAAYLIVDPKDQQHVMIDCGGSFDSEKLLREIRQFNIKLGNVAIYASHIHADHIAGAPSFPDSPVYIHGDGIDAALRADPEKTASFLYPGLIYPDLSYAQPIQDGHEVAAGKSTVIFTHAPGHAEELVYAKIITDEGVILAASDLLWGGYSERMGSNYDQWTNSLDLLAQDKFDYVTFGHNVSRLIPNAMRHIDYARSVFLKDVQPQDDGLLDDPWAAVWNTQSLAR